MSEVVARNARELIECIAQHFSRLFPLADTAFRTHDSRYPRDAAHAGTGWAGSSRSTSPGGGSMSTGSYDSDTARKEQLLEDHREGRPEIGRAHV